MAGPLHLSVIIPAYNEANRLPDTLERTFQYLRAQSYTAEIIVVENGSSDGTAAVARDFIDQHGGSGSSPESGGPIVRLIQESRAGKGLAVRSGMLAAQGDYRFMCDADLSMPIEQVSRFLPPEHNDFEISIGSREAQGAVRYDEPHYRHFGGRAINSLIRLAALPGLQDTQCGFKCFTAAAAEVLFRKQTLLGWSFDIELLYIARLLNYRIIEVPIDWYFNPETKLNPIQDSLKMSRDIWTIRRNARKGRYDLALGPG